MDNSNNRLIAISLAILVLFLGMAFLAFLLRSPAKKTEKVTETFTELETIVEKDIEKEATPVKARFSSISLKPAARKSPFTKKDVEEINLNRQTAQRQLRQAHEKWLLNQIENESLNERTREKYRLKTLDSFEDGLKAFKEGEYEKSINLLIKSLKDPKATPISQYLTLIYLRSAANRLKNFELFLELSRTQAKLIQTEDLSSLGIDKTDNSLTFCNEIEELYKAATSNRGYNKALENRIFAEGGIPLNLKVVKKQLDSEIEEFKKEFRGFFSDA